MWSLLCLAVLSALLAPSHQNNLPVFTDDLVNLIDELQNIPENTEIGTSLGSISCNDADGDRVEYGSSDNKYLDVDSNSGIVTVKGQFDAEIDENTGQDGQSKLIKVRFLCMDLDTFGAAKSTATVDFDIDVKDMNDHIPEISLATQQGLTFYVSEAAMPGTTLDGTLTITDRDKGTFNSQIEKVEFDCSRSETTATCEHFQIVFRPLGSRGKYSANIVLQTSVDYETRNVYNVRVLAIDGGTNPKNTGSIGFRILVNDSQDSDPSFTTESFNFEIEEGVPVNTVLSYQLSAKDGDEGSWRQLTFDVLDNPDGINLFKFGDATEGQDGFFHAPVVVRSEIDREKVGDSHQFTARAIELDKNGTRTSATATIVVTATIKDINDNAPLFTRNVYNASVPEVIVGENQATLGQKIAVEDLQVNDRDRGINARFKVEIIQQTRPGAFGVSPSAVVEGDRVFFLTVNNFEYVDYDKEDYRSQVVVLRAVETETQEARSSTATVSMTITDVNDHSPVFERDSYEASISENAALQTSILTLKAKDDDTGLNGDVLYRMTDRFRDVFDINSETGEMFLIALLNYEEKKTYAFPVFAMDKGEQPRFSHVLVVVRVTDYNEDGPKFTSEQYTAEVAESSTTFLDPVRVEAIDSSDTLANITYRIVSGNTPTNSFVMNMYTGELSLREKVDFEQTPNVTGYFRLGVEASDNGQPPVTAQTLIIVRVLDENNNGPVFDPRQYYKTISEAVSPGTFLLQVSATDGDYGTNGQIRFRIGTGAQDSFNVLEDGKVYISTNPTFDYDINKNLNVQVIATDGGSPQYTATATMFITITDANNKPPVFEKRSYTKILDEATPKGAEVLQVNATDKDTNHTLRYTLQTDTIDAYSKAGMKVNGYTNYDLTKVFSVDSRSGKVFVAQDGPGLDRSFFAEMAFQVRVEDIFGVNQYDTAYLTVIIIGKPKTELYFNMPWSKGSPQYTRDISESFAVGSKIMTLQARDPAAGGQVVTLYEEVPLTDAKDYFVLSQSRPGELLLNKPLDYESGDRHYSVVIRAIKEATQELGRRSVTTTVNINVQDANDNAPQFTQQVYRFTVREGEMINTIVAEITAYDQDSPSYGPIEFILGVGQDRDDFRLYSTDSANTVQLLVNRQLDYERRSRYDLEIIAKDNKNSVGSSLRLNSKARIIITLEDENDNGPEFSDKKRSFSVPETAPIDTRLGQVLAKDKDTGLNGNIYYTLDYNGPYSQTADPLKLFGITDVSGMLVTKQNLQGLGGSYEILVIATDRGSPPKSASIPVTIKIQGVDDDDGTPKWVSPVQFVTSVTEHNKTKLDINIRAVPRTPNAKIVYSLSPFGFDYQYFRIDPTTAELFVTADLDREFQESYSLLIQATDSLNRTLMSRRQLTVHLIDVDDNDPSFQKSSYSACPNDFDKPTYFSTPDDTVKDTIVGYVEACDPDGPGKNEMLYYRYTGDEQCLQTYNNALQVNLNGSIQSTKPLDYEEKRTYLVCVEVRPASAAGGRRKREEYDINKMKNSSKVGYVIVTITDRNDNGPIFPEDDKLGVLMTLPSEDAVTQVKAIDPDGPLNNRVLYAIKSIMYYPPNGRRPFPMRGSFTINPDNGVVSTNLPSYQDFAHGYFQLEVKAFDAKNRLFNDSILVTLVVHQRSQILRVVLNKPPMEGQKLANDLLEALNEDGKPSGKQFFFIKVSEHRTGSKITPTQTDVCFLVVENKRAYDASDGLRLLDSDPFESTVKDAGMVDRGTCYPLLSTENTVKWRDLWWVLVIIAIFIFVCAIILIITITILYDRYKNYMGTEKTYLVPQ